MINLENFKKGFVNLRNKWSIALYNFQGRNILEVKLDGGLCNKIFCLMAACDMCHDSHYRILEPEFGWKEKILFSDIYDIAFFNQQMKLYFGIDDFMVKRDAIEEQSLKSKIRYNKVEQNKLWSRSESNLSSLRLHNVIYENSALVQVLRSLKLKKEYNEFVKKYKNDSVALQVRIESDWIKHSKCTPSEPGEHVIVDLASITAMLKDFGVKDIFFTTGENQNTVQKYLQKHDVRSHYFFDESLEYEINAAINFEILCQAKMFIGLSRSTFANLITLKRQLLLKTSENYIYNYGTKIINRVDYGLYFRASESISKKPAVLKDKVVI